MSMLAQLWIAAASACKRAGLFRWILLLFTSTVLELSMRLLYNSIASLGSFTSLFLLPTSYPFVGAL